MILAIDTSTRYAGVALADAQRVLSWRCWYSSVNHTAELMPAVADTLHSWGITPSELDGIAVALGPGGFSALRVGVSAAKGLALAGKRPIIGIGTLDLEAFPYLDMGLHVCALLDAGRGEMAAALFGPDGNRTREDMIVTPEKLMEAIERGSTNSTATIFCGEGAPLCADLIRKRLGNNGLVISHYNPATRLSSLVELTRPRMASGDSDDLATLQPYYLRLPSIGGPKTRDRVPQQS